jgi:peptidoglycan/xylan/chitin deacetylase (PgdA/CDA1 family)
MTAAGKPLVVLAYHGLVRETQTVLNDFCFVTPQRLDADLKCVAESGWKLVGLNQGVSALEDGSLDSPSVAVTFDDGFSSVVRTGADILRDNHCRATIFLPSGCVKNGESLWFARVIALLKNTTRQEFEFLGRSFVISDFQSRCTVNRYLQDILRCLHPQAILILVERLKETLQVESDDVGDELKLMSLADCDSALRSGVFDFGGHSASHAIHSQLDSRTLKTEICDSLNFLAEIGAGGPRLYAYPNGRRKDFSLRCEKILAENNVYCALSTIAGWNYSLKDRFAIRRFCVGPQTDLRRLLSPLRWQFARWLP